MSTKVDARDLVITRVFDAPVEQVWRAWTDPETVKRWWGPTDYTSHKVEIDFREGGRYIFHMRAPQDQGGTDFYDSGVYRAIVPMERIEYSDHFSDAEGNPIDPTSMGMPPEFPREMSVILTFRRQGAKTELRITHRGLPEGQIRDLSEQGMNESLDKLERVLEEG